MKIGSLCSGYGGLTLAVQQVLGGTVAWHSEFDAAPSKVLEARFPDVPNLGDMTAVDWSAVEPVDVLEGGTPCQDVSHAGGRKGMGAGTRSGLWSAMATAIDVLRPGLVFWENVRGVASARADSDVEPCPGCVGDRPGLVLRALGRVLGDLADLGYDARWIGLRASDVGAPHARFRYFVAAYPADVGHERARSAWGWRDGSAHGGDSAANPDSARRSGVGREHHSERDTDGRRSTHTTWGPYEPAIRRWERITGRAAPRPRMTSARGGQQLSPQLSEWMMGLPAGWVTDVPGISRTDQLKILGNGVVPQQGAAALRHLLGC